MAESQAQLPVRYLSRDSKFKPKSMPAVRYISYLDSVSIQGRAWRRSDRATPEELAGRSNLSRTHGRTVQELAGWFETVSLGTWTQLGVREICVVTLTESVYPLPMHKYTGIGTDPPFRLSIESQSRIPESLALEIDNRHSLILKSARV